MYIQFGSNKYVSTLKRDAYNRLSDDLFLGNKKKKATYEIKKENGYVRHIVTKEDGKKVIIREVKLPKSEENKESSGDVKEMITQKLATQLFQSLDDRQNQRKFSKTGLAGQKENQISKYTMSM